MKHLPLVYDHRIRSEVLMNLRTAVVDGKRFILPHSIHTSRSEDGTNRIIGFVLKPVTHLPLVKGELELKRVTNKQDPQRAFEKACDVRNNHVSFSDEHLLFLKSSSRACTGRVGISQSGTSIRVNVSNYYELFNLSKYDSRQHAIKAAIARRDELLRDVAWLMDTVTPYPSSLNSLELSL